MQDIVVTSTHGEAVVAVDSVPVGSTPLAVRLARRRDHVITVAFDTVTRSTRIESRLSPLVWLNTLFWPGYIVDFSTGGAHRLGPESFHAAFDAASAGSRQKVDTMRVIVRNGAVVRTEPFDRSRAVCLLAAPRDRCRSFPIFELAAEQRLAGPQPDPRAGAFRIGYAVNVGDRAALALLTGASFWNTKLVRGDVATDTGIFRGQYGVRGHRWVSRTVAVDLDVMYLKQWNDGVDVGLRGAVVYRSILGVGVGWMPVSRLTTTGGVASSVVARSAGRSLRLDLNFGSWLALATPMALCMVPPGCA